MSVYPRRGQSAGSAHASTYGADSFARWDVVPQDRIGPLPSRPGRKFVLAVLAAGSLAGGWALLKPEQVRHALSLAKGALGQARIALATTEPAKPTGGAKPAEIERQPAAEGPLAQSAKLDTPLPAERPDRQLAEPAAPSSSPSSPKTQVINEQPAGAVPAAREQRQVAKATTGSSYAPPPSPPADPLRQRAEAAGLHPEISRAVLMRLSAVDLRNAGVAIVIALAQTPDADVLVWPRQRKPDEALFRVHFVAGAAPECRRYVVTVTKDGWSTTALPMERCGVKRGAQQRQ